MSDLIDDPGVIEKALRLVTVAVGTIRTDNGYKNTVLYVGRELPGENDLESLAIPAAFVVRRPGSRSPIEWRDGDVYGEQLDVDLIGYIRTDGRKAADFGLAGRGEAMVSDFKKLAMADPHFGDRFTIHNSRIVDSGNDGGTYDGITAVCGIGLILQLYFDGVNP